MINLKPVENLKFELLIGKDISHAIKTLNTDYNIFDADLGKVYIFQFDNSRKFFGFNYDKIVLGVDKSNVIQTLSINLSEYFDDNFYKLFTSEYGSPSKILGIKSRKKIGEIIDSVEEEGRRITETKLEMEEVTLSQDPLFVFWIKEDYQIKILNRKKGFLKGSELTFSKVTNQI